MSFIQNTSPHTATLSKNKLSTKEIVLIGMFAAILTIISQISIPTPSGVPITIQVFGIVLIGVVLGSRISILTTIVYILMGAVGLPVFANFKGGLGVLTSLTGGYIFAWPVTAWLCGIKHHHINPTINFSLNIFYSIVGVLFMEIIGGLQWAYLAGGETSLTAIFIYSITVFVPKDIIITIFAVIIGQQVKKPLMKAGLLS